MNQRRKFSGAFKTDRGYSLVEVMVAIVILGIVGVFALGAISTSLLTSGKLQALSKAKNLAEIQMDYVKNLSYNATYIPGPIPTGFSRFSVSEPILVEPVSTRDGNLQKITITILYNGEPLDKLEDYKVKR